MKTTKLITTLMLALSFSIPTIAKSQEFVFSPMKPETNPFLEGTERVLTVAQIAEVLPWAKNSKLLLEDLLSSLDGLSTEEKIERMLNGIKQGVIESAPKHSELFMRYTLNRAMVIDELLTKEMDQDVVGSSDVRLRVLIASARMALRYFETDMGILTRGQAAPFASFGFEYFRFLNEVNKSIFDASAQYKVGRVSLQWFQMDLYRDINNQTYATKIVKINTELQRGFPESLATDARYISSIRNMKGLIRKLL